MSRAPHFIEQLTLSHDAVCMLNEDLQEFVFNPRQPHFVSGYHNAPSFQINFDISEFEGRCVRGLRCGSSTSQSNPKARQQFPEGEWLADEVIGSGIQRFYFVAFVPAD